MENEKKNPEPLTVTVRAFPMPGHVRRWCGEAYFVPDPKNRPDQEMEELPTGGLKPVFNPDGSPRYKKHALPWPADDVTVYVVDDPPPFDPLVNGGRPTHISHKALAQLRQDHRISVSAFNSVDARTVTEAKLAAVEAEQKLQAAQREIAQLHEERNAFAEATAAKAAAKIAKLEAELEAAKKAAKGGK